LKVYNGTSWVNFDADTVDGFHASQTPQANIIPVAGPTGKLDAGWIPTIWNLNQVEFSSSGSWTVPNNVSKILVVAVGGGGGGGGGTSSSGGEGGYSGHSSVILLTVSPGETLTITIGAGGAGGSGTNTGGTGGNTVITGSVSGTLLTVNGGIGGRGIISSNNHGFGGMSSIFGRGGKGGYLSNGENAPNLGAGGGGGGGVTTGSSTGGSGGNGFVRIIYLI
jgi:hypothetical protein